MLKNLNKRVIWLYLSSATVFCELICTICNGKRLIDHHPQNRTREIIFKLDQTILFSADLRGRLAPIRKGAFFYKDRFF